VNEASIQVVNWKLIFKNRNAKDFWRTILCGNGPDTPLTSALGKGDQAMKVKLAFVFLLLPLYTSPQEPKKQTEEKPAVESKSTTEPAKRINPVKPTPSSIASAKKSYNYDCAMCHGKEGAGDGELAESMHLKLRDYRDPATLKDLTDGEIYSIIANGKGQMTGEEGRMKPERIWDMVNYIRALAKNKPG
jgi:mono/diheme cytochrome c family protein